MDRNIFLFSLQPHMMTLHASPPLQFLTELCLRPSFSMMVFECHLIPMQGPIVDWLIDWVCNWTILEDNLSLIGWLRSRGNDGIPWQCPRTIPSNGLFFNHNFVNHNLANTLQFTQPTDASIYPTTPVARSL